MKEEDLQQLLDRLAKKGKSKYIPIAHPDAREYLIKQGAQQEEAPKISLEESIDRLFSDRKEALRKLGEELPDPLGDIALPDIEALYDEISECILFGLNGAAITLSGVLVEFALKRFTYVHQMGGFIYDEKKWDRFENMNLNDAIKEADGEGLLVGDEKKKLKRFKDSIRNPYNHYNIKKITKQVKWEKVARKDFKTGEVEELDIDAKDDPSIQTQAKPIVDKRQVFRVFQFADEIVKRLFSRVVR